MNFRAAYRTVAAGHLLRRVDGLEAGPRKVGDHLVLGQAVPARGDGVRNRIALCGPVALLLRFDHHGTTLVDYDHAISLDGLENHLRKRSTALRRGAGCAGREAEPLALRGLTRVTSAIGSVGGVRRVVTARQYCGDGVVDRTRFDVGFGNCRR